MANYADSETKSRTSEDLEASISGKARDYFTRVRDMLVEDSPPAVLPCKSPRTSSSQSFENISFSDVVASEDLGITNSQESTSSVESIELQTPISSVTSESETATSPEDQSNDADNENSSGDEIMERDILNAAKYERFAGDSSQSCDFTKVQSTSFSHSHVTDHSFNKRNESDARIKELRLHCQPQKDIFGKIAPLEIAWARKTTEDRIWDYDDLFLRLVFCVSDVCILRWEVSSPKEFKLEKFCSPKVEFLSALIDSFDIFIQSCVCCSSLIDLHLTDEDISLLKSCLAANGKEIFANSLVESESDCIHCPSDLRSNAPEEKLGEYVLRTAKRENLDVPVDFTMPLTGSESEDLITRCMSSSLQEKPNFVAENYVPAVPETLVADSKLTMNLKEVEDLEPEVEALDMKSELVNTLREQNENMSNRLFETEVALEDEKPIASADKRSHISQMRYSTQSTFLDVLEAGESLLESSITRKQSPYVVAQQEKSTAGDLESLHTNDDSEVVYTDDGRVCLGDNSSFSIMYAHRSYQPPQVETEPVREITQNVAQRPGRCSQDGDHSFSESKARIMKIRVQQSIQSLDEEVVDRKEIPNSSMSIDPVESSVPCVETGTVLESPNRSFCFTSTPAQSSGSVSASNTRSLKSTPTSKIPRIPQLRPSSLNKSGDKVGYPPRSFTNKNSITPRNVNPTVKPPTSLPKLNLRDSRIPRPSIPSGGDSSRSGFKIPSNNSRMSDRSTPSIMTTYSSGVRQKPPVVPTPKQLTRRPALAASPGTPITSKKPSVANTKVPKPAAVSKNTPAALNDATMVQCIDRIKYKLKGNKEAHDELGKLFNEALNSSNNFRDSGLSSLQLAKVLSKFDPAVGDFSLRDRQKLASKMISSKEQKIDYKTFMTLYAK